MFGFSLVYAVDFSEHPGLIDAVKKYYATVEKAKLSYENELRKVLSNIQRAGNVKAYNATEAELWKDGFIDAARDVDLLASAVEPPRFYIEKHGKDVPIPVLKIDLPLADTLPSDWLEKLPKAKIVKQFEGRVCY